MSYNKNLMKSYQGKPCICCGTTIGTVAHHVKSKGSGGSDDPDNIMVLCNKTHRVIHDHGLSFVAINIEEIEQWLKSNGWEYCSYRKKWVKAHED